jgi:outer membrane biosynthesis protein TonB
MKFKNNINYQSKNGMPKSLIMHILLLLIAFFFTIDTDMKDPDPDKPYKVVMEMDFRQEVVKRPKPVEPKLADFEEESSNSTKSDADKGESRPLNPEVQKVKVNDPKPPVPTPTPTPTPPVKTAPVVKPSPPSKPISTPDESPVKVKENPIDIDKPTKDNVPTRPTTNSAPPTTRPTNTSTTPTTKPGAGTVGSPTGTGTKPQSQTDGDGRGKSNTGTGSGSTSGSDVTSGTGNSSDGTGEFDGSGNGIFKRKVIYKNYNALPMTMSGKVVIKTCINRAGLVTYTEILQSESTIKDRAVLKKSLSAAKGYRYEADNRAPAEQCGKLTISLDINRLK